MGVRQTLYRVDPLSYSFASGIFVSIAANLFTGVYSADSLPVRTSALLWAAALSLASGIGWIVVAAEVEKFGRLVSRMMGTGLEKERAETEVLAASGVNAAVAFAVATVLAASCLVVLIPIPAAHSSSSGTKDQSSIPAASAASR